jgi:hypothetical protein
MHNTGGGGGVFVLVCNLHRNFHPCGLINECTKVSIVLKWKAILNQAKATFHYRYSQNWWPNKGVTFRTLYPVISRFHFFA